MARGTTVPSALVLARLAGAAALGVPGVVALDHGRLGEFATHGPGDRFRGVQVEGTPPPTAVGVRVVVDARRPVHVVGDEVAVAVAQALATALPDAPPPVHVHVADLRWGDEPGSVG